MLEQVQEERKKFGAYTPLLSVIHRNIFGSGNNDESYSIIAQSCEIQKKIEFSQENAGKFCLFDLEKHLNDAFDSKFIRIMVKTYSKEFFS